MARLGDEYRENLEGEARRKLIDELTTAPARA
jgi:hypothetical protein